MLGHFKRRSRVFLFEELFGIWTFFRINICKLVQSWFCWHLKLNHIFFKTTFLYIICCEAWHYRIASPQQKMIWSQIGLKALEKKVTPSSLMVTLALWLIKSYWSWGVNIENIPPKKVGYFLSSFLCQLMINCWFGLVVWIPGIPLWKGWLLGCIPRIPNHRPKPPISH